MRIWENPFYRATSLERGPRGWDDAHGWLVGRGGFLCALRLLPASMPLLLPLVRWVLPHGQGFGQAFVLGLACSLGAFLALRRAAQAASVEWREGRIRALAALPGGPTRVVAGLVWGAALPLGAALTAGALAALPLWPVAGAVGIPSPVISPAQWLAVAADTWAVLFLAASVGACAGMTRWRPDIARAAALAAGIPLLAVAGAAISIATLFGGPGEHLLVIGGAWLVGGLFHRVAEESLAVAAAPSR